MQSGIDRDTMTRHQKMQTLIRRLKQRRQPQSIALLAEALCCTERNVKDIIRQLRDEHLVPVIYDRQANGYHLDKSYQESFELNEAWFSPAELHALMTSHHLLANVQPGWLDEHIEPLKSRIETLLQNASDDFTELQQRVRILQIAARPVRLEHFKTISNVLLSRQRLHIAYHGRDRDKVTEREISPQRLVYYRNNWYLDAWCHNHNALRTFSVDRLQITQAVSARAIDVPEAEMDDQLASAYGIFAGQPDKSARLRFSAKAATWVADEHWHDQQQGRMLRDGSYELRVPYSDPLELIMDVLKYGAEVEVLGPESLRQVVAQRTQAMSSLYNPTPGQGR